MVDITSLKNPKIKLAQDLREKRDRDRNQLFLIEGFRELTRALKGGVEIETLFYCPELFLGTNESTILDACPRKLETSSQVFHKISYRDRPDGLLAIAKIKRKTLKDIPLKKPPFLLVAEAIEKPGNLGTLLRSSDAVGIDGVIVVDKCTDIFNPNVVRSSVGTLFTIPVVEATGDETIEFLRKNDIQIVSTTPSATSEYTEVDLTKPIAIVVGTEQLGLSDKWLDQADIKVRIPMLGVADSLNVATATTLMLYEALRQRRIVRR